MPPSVGIGILRGSCKFRRLLDSFSSHLGNRRRVRIPGRAFYDGDAKPEPFCNDDGDDQIYRHYLACHGSGGDAMHQVDHQVDHRNRFPSALSGPAIELAPTPALDLLK